MSSYGFFEDDSVFEQVTVSKNTRCGTCGLSKGCITPKMKPSGKGKIPILWIAEAPGKNEDQRGVQLIGKAGKRLRRRIKQEMGIDLDDCRKMNAVNCRPPKNKTPTMAQILACRPMIMKEINRFKPKMIVLLGDSAVKSVIGTRWQKSIGSFERWRGRVIPDQKFGSWIGITYHPSYVLRKDNDSPIDLLFRGDLKKFSNHLKGDNVPDFSNYEKKVKIIRDEQIVIKWLKKIISSKPALLTFDYEATGLKPHAKGHRIICVSLCWNKNFSISFMLTKKIKPYLIRILQMKEIGKIAANMKFEELWSRRRLPCKVVNWVFDTMLAAHVLDNRNGVTGLKFQVYINYGIPDYDSKVEPFIDTKQKSANSFNRLNEMDDEDVLLYCGLDGYFEHSLALKQMLQMGIIDPKTYAQTGTLKIADVQTLYKRSQGGRTK